VSAPSTLLDTQSDALLRRLERERDARARRAREDAEAQALELVRRARSEARARVREAVIEIRRDESAALAQRLAALDTRRRRALQATLRSLLEAAWASLPAALSSRWNDPIAREEWCGAACAEGARRLRTGSDVGIEVDAADAASVGSLAQRCLTGLGVEQTIVVPVTNLGAGLRLRAGGACLDATVPGLLASRGRVAADLLAEFERAADEPHGSPA
jgi:vacuolar-type H+-ATPase subunit E/Vma4